MNMFFFFWSDFCGGAERRLLRIFNNISKNTNNFDIIIIGKSDKINDFLEEYIGEPVSYTHLDVYKRQHPERYIKFMKSPSLINEFVEEGFLFQLNIGSITGDFGKEVKKTAELFLKNKIYSFLGSDAHRDEKRNPNMSKGIEILKEMDNNYFNYLRDSSERLLNDDEIEFIGDSIKEKKRLLSIFSKR